LGTEIREGGYPRETQGADSEDLAYKGLEDLVPPRSRVDSTTPSRKKRKKEIPYKEGKMKDSGAYLRYTTLWIRVKKW
jgi:hypothetical protein